MRRTAWFLIAGAILCTATFAAAADADIKKDFDSANDLYRTARYEKAVEAYETMLQKGFSSAEVYYNLGNGYYRSGRIGPSVWAFERAYRLNPRDKDIRWNLDLARRHVRDRTETAQRIAPLEFAKKALSYLRSDEIAWALAVCVGLLSISVIGAAFFEVRKALFVRMIFVFLILSMICGGTAYWRWTQVKVASGIVLDAEVYVRYGPGSANTRAFKLHEGAKVAIQEESGGWYSVRFAGSQGGWLPADSVLKI